MGCYCNCPAASYIGNLNIPILCQENLFHEHTDHPVLLSNVAQLGRRIFGRLYLRQVLHNPLGVDPDSCGEEGLLGIAGRLLGERCTVGRAVMPSAEGPM